MHKRLGCVGLGCHVVDLMLFLFSAQSAVNSRALIKQTFGDTYSDGQNSGQPKLVRPPLPIPRSLMFQFCLLMNILQKHEHTMKHWGKWG